jgi:hypothetical protein
MTNNTGALVERVEDLASALREAQEDAALLERLSQAKAEVKRLAPLLETAQAELSEAMASEVETRRAAAYANIKDIKITEGSTTEGLLSRPFTITYVRNQWDGRETVQVTNTVAGFGSLPDEAWGYLLNVRPDQVPASILSLSPTGDAWEAFNEYFTSQKRGWVRRPVTEADAA